MERERTERVAGMPKALQAEELRTLLQGRKFWTERGYDHVAGEYRYTLTIVLASGEQAIRDD